MTAPPVRLADRAFTPDEARAVASWSYEAPFDFYGLSGDDAVALLVTRDERGQGYYPVLAGNQLAGDQVAGDQVVGFVCFGPEARVRGQEERAGTCDVGAGLDPARLGEGIGTSVVQAAVRFAVDRFGAARVRAAVAAFNDRSMRLCTSAGSRRVREFEGPAGRPFVEFELAVDRLRA